MSAFPALKTGAVLQYPAQRIVQFSTEVVQFVDGTEQRFQNYASPLHTWVVQLDLLDEQELHVLREFFLTEAGAAGDFSFTDPWDGTEYPSCSFATDVMPEDLQDEAKGKTSLTLLENRS